MDMVFLESPLTCPFGQWTVTKSTRTGDTRRLLPLTSLGMSNLEEVLAFATAD